MKFREESSLVYFLFGLENDILIIHMLIIFPRSKKIQCTQCMSKILKNHLISCTCKYYSCRLLHHPRIYKYIHKIHHEWTAPISITAIYAHPIEHLISNVFPVLMGPLVMGSHVATCWLWFALAISTTLVSHCGYHLPLLPSPEAHDYHHQK